MSTIHGDHMGSETERLRTALHRERRARAMLARAKDSFEVVLAAGCVGFCRIPANRRRVVANVHFKAHFGWPPDALLQRNDIEARIHVEDRAAFERALSAALADGRPVDVTVRAVWPCGTIQFIALRGRCVSSEAPPSATARAPGNELVLVASNVTAEHRMVQEFQAGAQRDSERCASAAATERASLDLLSRVSHELRSPLNAMLGWNRILAMKRCSDPEVQAITARIAQGGRSQLGIVNDLLDVGRIGAGKFAIDPRAMKLATVAAGALEDASAAAQSKDITIAADLAATAGEMQGDMERLRQVIAHLLGNAIKFTPSGGRVRLWLRREGSMLEFGVADTGQGIAPEMLPHLFDRRAVDSNHVHGLGVGLLLAREIVARHGGTLQLESEGTGRGTTVRVRLPAQQGDTTNVAASTAEEAVGTAPRASRRLAGMRLLLVDDELDARAVVAELLQLEGAEVCVCESAASAYTKLAAPSSTFDALVSDIGMPQEDGYSLVRRLRAGGNRILAVALTGLASTQDALAAREAGFNLHVPKPLDIDRFVAAVSILAPRRSAASSVESARHAAAP